MFLNSVITFYPNLYEFPVAAVANDYQLCGLK